MEETGRGLSVLFAVTADWTERAALAMARINT
jgi:hypothetical protein